MIGLGLNLSFNGECEAAFRFYERALGGKITVLIPWGSSPMAKDVPAEWAAKITHASITIGDRVLTGGDTPSAEYQEPRGFHVILNTGDGAEADRLFDALAEGGTIEMPPRETFWASRFAMLTDRFGTPWIINCGRPSRTGK